MCNGKAHAFLPTILLALVAIAKLLGCNVLIMECNLPIPIAVAVAVFRATCKPSARSVQLPRATDIGMFATICLLMPSGLHIISVYTSTVNMVDKITTSPLPRRSRSKETPPPTFLFFPLPHDGPPRRQAHVVSWDFKGPLVLVSP